MTNRRFPNHPFFPLFTNLDSQQKESKKVKNEMAWLALQIFSKSKPPPNTFFKRNFLYQKAYFYFLDWRQVPNNVL